MQDAAGGLALVYHHLIWVMLFVCMHYLIIAKFEIDCSRQQGSVFKAVCPMLLQHIYSCGCMLLRSGYVLNHVYLRL